MPADLFPASLLAELVDRSRALQRATAAATADGRAAFARLLAARVAVRAEIARLRPAVERADAS